MNSVRLLDLGLAPWLRTQSVYHALAETMSADSPDTIVLARPDRAYLCVGYHQELASVLDLEACERMGLTVVRRRVGGGATYLDSNQLFYQCIFHHSRVPATVTQVYARLLSGPVGTLRALGVNAELVGENEIEVRGRRIAGIGGGRIGEAAVVVGNLLFDFDYDRMSRAWRAPSEPFRRLAAAALRERVTTLRAEAGEVPSMDAAASLLIAEFERALGRPLVRGDLSAREERAAARFEARLVSRKWLGLHANGGKPMTSLKVSRAAFVHAVEAERHGVRIRGALESRDGRICRALLESDPARDWAGAEARLIGQPVTEWTAAISANPRCEGIR